MKATMTEPTTKTFRGRSMEDVLAQIRAEMGEDAIVLRCREGLAGGVGGFFQRPLVEIEAAPRPAGIDVRSDDDVRAPAFGVPDVPELEVRSDRATAEGLASPAVQLLLSQAAPFAEQLRAAQREPQFVPMSHEDLVAAVGFDDPKLYGPQPAVPAPPAEPALPPEPVTEDPVEALVAEWFADVPAVVVPPAPAPASPPEPAPTAPLALASLLAAPLLPAVVPGHRDDARNVKRRLVALGVDPTLADDLVGEAAVHGAVFDPAGGIERSVRAAIEQRTRTIGHRGPGGLTLAVTGPAAEQSEALVGQLAAAYATAGVLPVVVVALRSAEVGAALADRLDGTDARVELAVDGRQAREIADGTPGAMVLVALPPVASASDAVATALASDLDDLAADELHLALPATSSAAVADELAELLDPLGLTHVALTDTDATRRPGAGLGFCLATGRAISYLCSRDAIAPATATAVADVLLP